MYGEGGHACHPNVNICSLSKLTFTRLSTVNEGHQGYVLYHHFCAGSPDTVSGLHKSCVILDPGLRTKNRTVVKLDAYCLTSNGETCFSRTESYVFFSHGHLG